MAAPTNLLMLNDNQILGFLQDVRILEAIPCLQGVKAGHNQKLPGCRRCSGRRKQLFKDTASQAKSCIANSGGVGKQQLGQILNAKQVRFLKYTNKGTVKVTVKLS